MKIDLAGKPALVVGSGGPIAAAAANALSENGAVVATARLAGPPTRLIGDDAAAAPLDPSGAADLSRFGRPWLLVAIHPGAERLPADDGASDGFTPDAAAFAALVRGLAPSLKRVVFVLSVAGLVALRACPRFSAGQASLVSVTRALAMESGAGGVSVNAVAVGAFDEVGVSLLSHTAIKRPARLAEIVAAILFLADPDNTYTTGHVTTVDGGFTAGYARNF